MAQPLLLQLREGRQEETVGVLCRPLCLALSPVMTFPPLSGVILMILGGGLILGQVSLTLETTYNSIMQYCFSSGKALLSLNPAGRETDKQQ